MTKDPYKISYGENTIYEMVYMRRYIKHCICRNICQMSCARKDLFETLNTWKIFTSYSLQEDGYMSNILHNEIFMLTILYEQRFMFNRLNEEEFVRKNLLWWQILWPWRSSKSTIWILYHLRVHEQSYTTLIDGACKDLCWIHSNHLNNSVFSLYTSWSHSCSFSVSCITDTDSDLRPIWVKFNHNIPSYCRKIKRRHLKGTGFHLIQ